MQEHGRKSVRWGKTSVVQMRQPASRRVGHELVVWADTQILRGSLPQMQDAMPKVAPAFFLSDEEFPMTMQVGMVGTDGVLIASDTLWMTRPEKSPLLSEKQSSVRGTSNATKL